MRTLQANAPSRTTATDGQITVGKVVQTSRVKAVGYIPEAEITGANTNTRLVQLVNRDQDGTGTTVIAALQFNSGVNGVENDEKALLLDAAVANRDVKKGDVLEWVSTRVGSGLADPGGLVRVEIA